MASARSGQLLRRAGLGVAAVAVVGLVAWGGLDLWRAWNVGPVQRGWEVAESHGCFACHGPGGATGSPDPGGGIGGAPTFTPDDLHAYADDEKELREWVRDGMPARFREDYAALGDERPLIRMPAFGGVLTERELDDVVAWLAALGGYDSPAAEAAAEGRELAARYGCFSCHGPGGRGDRPNPGSLKGYIPAWDGPDFTELARDDGEIREWILDGAPQRLRSHPVARWFLERQTLKMPAYRGHIPARDVERIVDYIRWLRR